MVAVEGLKEVVDEEGCMAFVEIEAGEW